jgi:hypothetical protein
MELIIIMISNLIKAQPCIMKRNEINVLYVPFYLDRGRKGRAKGYIYNSNGIN